MVSEMATNHSEELDPKVVVALIPDDGRFVLIRRRNLQHGLGGKVLEWAFPGGRREGNETPEEAVIREASEEVGLSVMIREKLLVRKHPNTLIEMAYFYCERTDSAQTPLVTSKKEQEEIAEIELVEAGDVLNRFTTDVHPVIQEFILSFAQDSGQGALQNAAD